MAPVNDKRLEALRTRRAQIEAELSRLEAKLKADNRKADTRKKILVGAVVLGEAANRPEIDRWLRKLLEQRLTKDRDRALFGLGPMTTVPEEPNENKQS